MKNSICVLLVLFAFTGFTQVNSKNVPATSMSKAKLMEVKSLADLGIKLKSDQVCTGIEVLAKVQDKVIGAISNGPDFSKDQLALIHGANAGTKIYVDYLLQQGNDKPTTNTFNVKVKN